MTSANNNLYGIWIVLSIAAVIISAIFLTACGGRKDGKVTLSYYVNVLQGTNSERDFSTGNTYPAVAMPWGLNFWTPQTRRNGDGWQYVWTDLKILGFKQTHQPSPWINDYGCFSLMPQFGRPEPDDKRRAESYCRENEKASPYYYGVLLDNGIHAEMTATESGAALRFRYPKNDRSIVILDCFPDFGGISVDAGAGKIIGYSRFHAKGSRLPENFATHFVIYFGRPINEFGIYADGKLQEGMSEFEGRNVSAYLSFNDAGEINVRTASSFISVEQAQVNYDRELGKRSFDKLCSNARKVWDRQLASIKVRGGSKEQLRTFYTAMYRTMLFPRKIHEYDKNGRQIHYGFYDGEVHEGPMYADNGFWDTFRAVHPLFTIICPSLSAELMDALLNIYDEGGWLPEWFSPGYRNCMIGQNSVSVITDALQKGIGSYDKSMMYEAILKCAENEGPTATGRVAAQQYDTYGYVPCDMNIKQSVSRTLEYAYNDFCISRFAELTGKSQRIVDRYRRRAENWKNVFDASIGFVRPKNRMGEWSEFYAPEMWGPDFTEGSAWHWTWCVFHDPAGLISMMGGEKSFIARLDSVFTAKPVVGLGTRKKMIHEMSEMIAGNMGQYAHGNQPIQHMVYLYNYAGVLWKTQEKVHEIISRLYSSGIEDGKGLCGDEDNGQTSAWYVFSALGFYPVCPGTGEYVIGSPMFEEAEISLPYGRRFIIKANGVSDKNIYIQSAKLNGKPFEQSYIEHMRIVAGGVLEFEMGPQPNKSWAAHSRPFSMSEN